MVVPPSPAGSAEEHRNARSLLDIDDDDDEDDDEDDDVDESEADALLAYVREMYTGGPTELLDVAEKLVSPSGLSVLKVAAKVIYRVNLSLQDSEKQALRSNSGGASPGGPSFSNTSNHKITNTTTITTTTTSPTTTTNNTNTSISNSNGYVAKKLSLSWHFRMCNPNLSRNISSNSTNNNNSRNNSNNGTKESLFDENDDEHPLLRHIPEHHLYLLPIEATTLRADLESMTCKNCGGGELKRRLLLSWPYTQLLVELESEEQRDALAKVLLMMKSKSASMVSSSSSSSLTPPSSSSSSSSSSSLLPPTLPALSQQRTRSIEGNNNTTTTTTASGGGGGGGGERLAERDSIRLIMAERNLNSESRQARVTDLESKIVRVSAAALDDVRVASWQKGVIILEAMLVRARKRLMVSSWRHMCALARQYSNANMLADRQKFCVHAAANASNDLYAWYHCVFYREVYRLRGPFWYKEARLERYRRQYRLSKGDLTALERGVVGQALCSKGTTYSNIQQHIYTVQALLEPPEYELFQRLMSANVAVQKVPTAKSLSMSFNSTTTALLNGINANSSSSSSSSSSSNSKVFRQFRLSFVEAAIYLTWQGKQGPAGVNLADIVEVRKGVVSTVPPEVDKRCISLMMPSSHPSATTPTSSPSPMKGSNKLIESSSPRVAPTNGSKTVTSTSTSNTCTTAAPSARPLDLFLTSEQERDSWFEMLAVLVAVEQGFIQELLTKKAARDQYNRRQEKKKRYEIEDAAIATMEQTFGQQHLQQLQQQQQQKDPHSRSQSGLSNVSLGSILPPDRETELMEQAVDRIVNRAIFATW